jgi:REP element-mobilizing transposase RayT
MARKPRLEIEGGLYHLITRGVDRRDIFHCREDHQKFLSLLAAQKLKLPFYLYAYCLMTNHIHLLIERRIDGIGKIMHRVLTGYCQYYNRRYKRTGHVLQGRHRSILCQSEAYLTELVRYIHLNPVRAKMVGLPEEYPFSSHRAYLGLEPVGIVDVDPVLRPFGVTREAARKHYADFVLAGAGLGPQERFYASENGILGSDEFVDDMIHRLGEHDTRAAALRRKAEGVKPEIRPLDLVRSVESACGVAAVEFCGKAKGARQVYAKEALILTGSRLGASITELSNICGLTSASVSRRHDIARLRIHDDPKFRSSCDEIMRTYIQHAT